MKIVHVLTRFLRAGAEENTLLNCQAQVEAGHEVHLVHGQEADAGLVAEASKAGIRLHQIRALVQPISPALDVGAAFHLFRLYRQLRPDIVHTHQSKAGVLGRFAAGVAGVPAVIHGVHIAPFLNAGRFRSGIYEFAERKAARCTDGFISVSTAMRRAYAERGIGRSDQHVVIRSGMDIARFRKVVSEVGDHRNMLDVPRIAMVSAFEPRKKQIDLVQGFRAFRNTCPDARLILAGDGSQRGAVERVIEELGLAHCVTLTGYRSDPERVIAEADVCVLLSEREGLPRVVVQYLAAGKPVIVSDLPGIGELVHQDENGVIVRSHNPETLAQAMANVLAPARYASFARAARMTDVSGWSAEAMCRETLRFYDTVLSRKAHVLNSKIRRPS